jgi:hypothetical protein
MCYIGSPVHMLYEISCKYSFLIVYLTYSFDSCYKCIYVWINLLTNCKLSKTYSWKQGYYLKAHYAPGQAFCEGFFIWFRFIRSFIISCSSRKANILWLVHYVIFLGGHHLYMYFCVSLCLCVSQSQRKVSVRPFSLK